MDIVSKNKRSEMMSGIQGKNTKPELRIRKALFNRGFRYRLYSKKLPGKPDIILKQWRAIIFIHECFWHGHNCHLFKWPSTRIEFWRKKIGNTAIRDKRIVNELKEKNWRVAIVWECSMRGKYRQDFESVIDQIAGFIKSDDHFVEIRSLE